MFLGTYLHRVDERNRLSIPKKFRSSLGKEAILTHGLDGCLFLYSQPIWKKIEKRIEQTPLTRADARGFARHILSGAMAVFPDQLGRIVLPGYLKQFAKIEKNVAILGLGERIEIWAQDAWEKYSQELGKKSEEIAERLAESGI